MSTYTDLKNRVKETITVGFRPEDRVTTQKVRFYNEENEYWGSFSGSLSGKVNIKTGNLLSVDIYDSTLINPVLKTKEGTIIDLGTMGNQLEELSVHVHENVKTSVDTNYELITQLSDAISAVPLDTEFQLSSLDFRLNNLSTECKQAISDEVSARISSDNQLSLSFDSKLTTLAQDVAKEDEKLRSEINNLSEQLNTEITTRISEDEKLSVNLSKYSDRKRHYDLFSMDMASQMPIKAKEFAVNKLINYNVPDGFVINDNAGNQVIGHIEDYNDTTKACKFTAYSDADYTITNEDGARLYPYAQILGLNPYIFDGSQTQKPCANNVHVLNYNRSGTFNEHQFDIRLMKSNIRNIVYGGSVIGHIFGAGTDNDVSSGVVQFSSAALINNNILSVFADNKEIPFSINLNNGEINEYDNGNSILRIQPSYPRFEFETGISSWPQKIIFNESGTEFGARIYQEYYIKSNNNVESFAVSMRPKHDLTLGQQDYFLSIDNNFEAIIKEYDDNSYDLLKYDTTNKKLSYTCEKKLFECPVIINDNNKTINLRLKSKVFNKSLDVTDRAEISFNELSNAVQESMLLLINQTYELVRNNDVLSCDITDAFGSRVKIILKNTGKIDITLSAANGATAIFGDDNDRVEFNTLTVYDDQTQNLGIEHNLDITNISFDTADRRVAAQGYLYITEASENSNEFIGLNFRKEYTSNKYQEIKNNDIVIEIPNKEDGSTISREFLFVINPTGTNNTKVNLKFVTEQGDPIDFFTQGNNKFEIDCGKYITFRLQEITHNKFVLLDWDQSVQESRLDDLDTRLNQEIDNRINAINSLSTALSTEINSLSVGLSTEINNLSTALSTEISSLSGNVYEILDIHSGKLSADRKDINFLLEVDKESMVYKGTLLSVDDAKDKTLSCYFKAALGINEDPQFMFKHGFTYRISADQNLIDHNNTNIVLRIGDVITFNQDSRISSICAEDFDIIHDYQILLNNLSTALSIEIGSLSTALSNEIIDLSVGLSTEIDNKFTLQSTTSKLSGEYNNLNNFVNRTLIDEDKDKQSKPGIVKIQDEFRYAAENDFRNYKMRMISGTIVLELI